MDIVNNTLLSKSGSICLLHKSAVIYSVHVFGIHLPMMKNPTGVMQDVHSIMNIPS